MLTRLTIIPGSLQFERNLERQILLLDGPNIDMTDSARVGNYGFEIDSVDQGFFEGDIFYTRVIESVDVVPD